MNTEKITPLEAIRDKCLDCTCNQPKEVRACEITKCPLTYLQYHFDTWLNTYANTKEGITEELRHFAEMEKLRHIAEMEIYK